MIVPIFSLQEIKLLVPQIPNLRATTGQNAVVLDPPLYLLEFASLYIFIYIYMEIFLASY